MRRRGGHFGKAGLAIASALLIAGCSDGMSDLHQFTQRIKQRPGGEIKKLPEFKPYKKFTYEPDGLHDPFTPKRGFGLTEEQLAAQKQEQQEAESGPSPDADRPREPLEQFPLDSLSMVGTLSRGGEQWGLVKTPEDVIQRVQKGDHLGQNYGQITRVTGDRIDVVEIVPNDRGGWRNRDAAISIGEQ